MKIALTLSDIPRIIVMAKARKPHQCESCQTAIARGSKYFYVNHHAIGEHRYCEPCGPVFIERLEAQIKAEGAIQ